MTNNPTIYQQILSCGFTRVTITKCHERTDGDHYYVKNLKFPAFGPLLGQNCDSYIITFNNNILHLRISCLEMGMVTIPQIITNLYSVLRIIVLKIQKDSCPTTKLSHETILSTDR